MSAREELTEVVVDLLRTRKLGKDGLPGLAEEITRRAVELLGEDRCICRQNLHAAHHLRPVPGCPWCSQGTPQAVQVVQAEGGTL